MQTLTIRFAYEPWKPMWFRYDIMPHNYASFYDVIKDFFSRNLEWHHFKQVCQIYPAKWVSKDTYKSLIDEDSCDDHPFSLERLFGDKMMIMSLDYITEYAYNVVWCGVAGLS
jgi:hypothetical protein